MATRPPRPRDLREELGKRGPFESPEQEAFLGVIRTAAGLMAGFEELFKAHGLSAAQYNVLRIVSGAGPAGRRSEQIAGEMITRDPDVTRLVDKLERRGYVARQRSPDDRRVVLVKLTAKGRALLGRLRQPVQKLHRRQLAHLGPRKLRLLGKLLFEARHPEKDRGSISSRSHP